MERNANRWRRVLGLYIITLVLIGSSLRAQGAGAGQQLVLYGVLQYRAWWLGDSTKFDACTVVRVIGQESAQRLVAATTLLDRELRTCGNGTTQHSPAASRRVMLDSLALSGDRASVMLTVRRGDYEHRERYELELNPYGKAWNVIAVWMSAGMTVKRGSP